MALFGALILMLPLHFGVPVAPLIEGLTRLVGLVPISAGVAINLMADRALHQAQTTVKPDVKPRALVTSGVYQISRNPMYLGFVLIAIGAATLLGTATPFVAAPALALFLKIKFIRYEERAMRENFGPRWENYQRTVRRWL